MPHVVQTSTSICLFYFILFFIQYNQTVLFHCRYSIVDNFPILNLPRTTSKFLKYHIGALAVVQRIHYGHVIVELNTSERGGSYLGHLQSPTSRISPISSFMALFKATKTQVFTYLLGVCPFSIAFLVFLNSSVSFVITDLIGLHQGEGDAVGNLGFADELLALVACPVWGLLSDRIGVRMVGFIKLFVRIDLCLMRIGN